MRPEPSPAFRYGCLAVFIIVVGFIMAFTTYWAIAHPDRRPGWHCSMRGGYCWRIPPIQT